MLNLTEHRTGENQNENKRAVERKEARLGRRKAYDVAERCCMGEVMYKVITKGLIIVIQTEFKWNKKEMRKTLKYKI